MDVCFLIVDFTSWCMVLICVYIGVLGLVCYYTLLVALCYFVW